MNSINLLKFHRVSVCFVSQLQLRSLSVLSFSIQRKQTSKIPVSSLLKPVSSSKVQNQSFWETFPSSALSFYDKDGLQSSKYNIIYRSKLFNYAFYSQFCSMGVMLMQLWYSSLYAYRSLVLNEVVERVTNIGPFEVNYNAATMAIFAFFSFQNVVLYYLAQRPVLRIYEEKGTDKYVFVTLSHNPFQSRLTTAKPGDLKDLNIESLMCMFGNYDLKGRKVFLKPDNFKERHHFIKLLKE